MTEFHIHIAGHTAAVRARFESTRSFCSDYLCQGTPELTIALTPEDIAFERTKSAREEALEGLPVREWPDPYLETIALQRKLAEGLFAFDILLFHGSVVAVDGKAYLFTAKSGTGKSTHTRLWRELLGERAVMVNDDKPFLAIAPDGVLACGSPWNGKHRLGENIHAPLEAICILERGAENRIRPVTAKEALPMLVQQSNRPRNAALTAKYLELLDALVRSASFYRMECNMELDAARLAYETMSGLGKE